MISASSVASKFADTARAFDSVANEYDGALGNNALIQRMRVQVMRRITQIFSHRARLLDLGCGTGIDAAYLAARGYSVVGIDVSAAMVKRTQDRMADARLQDYARVLHLGIHELDQWRGDPFDGMYSNFGSLNCVENLRAVSRQAARLLKPRGKLIASVIGKWCPWEIALYAVKGNWQRARTRWARDAVPVPLGSGKIWTRYYSPREFYREFTDEFALTDVRALNLFLPPPYLIHAYERHPKIFSPLAFLDDHLGSAPLLRNMGDHFLIELTKRN